MSESESAAAPEVDNTAIAGAVVVGAVPEQPAKVLKEAAKYAKLLDAPLVVVHVDVTRFVEGDDPDGYVHPTAVDIDVDGGKEELDQVTAESAACLDGHGLDWHVRQLVGDPALAMKYLADEIDSPLIVVGTRKRGIGESIREFFTGSIAARLAQRQRRSILVVPISDILPADTDPLWEEDA